MAQDSYTINPESNGREPKSAEPFQAARLNVSKEAFNLLLLLSPETQPIPESEEVRTHADELKAQATESNLVSLEQTEDPETVSKLRLEIKDVYSEIQEQLRNAATNN